MIAGAFWRFRGEERFLCGPPRHRRLVHASVHRHAEQTFLSVAVSHDASHNTAADLYVAHYALETCIKPSGHSMSETFCDTHTQESSPARIPG